MELDSCDELIACFTLVQKFFNDADKTALWFKTSNPLLRDLAPIDLICIGMITNLYKFIVGQLAQNERF